MRNRSKTGAKPQSSTGSKDLGKSDPEALDEPEEVEGKLYQQDTGISIYVSRGRFDMQFSVKRHDDKGTKAWQSSTGQAGEIPCGYREAHAQIRSSGEKRHRENPRRLRLGWQGTSRGFLGCIRSSASLEFWRSRALRNRGRLGTRNLHKAHVRGDGTKHQHRRPKRTRRLRSGCVPERALERPDIFKFVGCGSKTPLVTRSCAGER